MSHVAPRRKRAGYDLKSGLAEKHQLELSTALAGFSDLARLGSLLFLTHHSTLFSRYNLYGTH